MPYIFRNLKPLTYNNLQKLLKFAQNSDYQLFVEKCIFSVFFAVVCEVYENLCSLRFIRKRTPNSRKRRCFIPQNPLHFGNKNRHTADY